MRWIKKDLNDLYQSVLPMFPSKSFIVSSITFRFLIHFEIIFVYDVRECSDSCFFFKQRKTTFLFLGDKSII